MARIEIVLNDGDMKTGKMLGYIRRQESANHKLDSGTNMTNNEKLRGDIGGARAEIALCVHLGLGKNRKLLVNDYGEQPDVGIWQVKWSAYEHHTLFVKPHNEPTHPVVWIVGTAPNLYIMGWQWTGWIQANYPEIEMKQGMGKCHYCPNDKLFAAESILEFNEFLPKWKYQ